MRSNEKQQAVIQIMDRSYTLIREIEAEYGLLVSGDDLRPRIEHFHDAVRTLSHQPELMYEKHTRLSVEWLAYDLRYLRYLQDKPLASLDDGRSQAPALPKKAGKKLIKVGDKNLPVEATKNPRSMPPNIRTHLVTHYASYTVMFAALFAETMDMNYQSRSEEHNTEVEQLAEIEQMLKELEMQQLQMEDVEQAINELENEEFKAQLMAVLHQRTQNKIARMSQMLKAQMDMNDMEIAQMDKAHTSFLSGQMVLYQDGKDLVKKLAAQGLNVAGQFLDNALSQAQGRGQGRGF